MPLPIRLFLLLVTFLLVTVSSAPSWAVNSDETPTILVLPFEINADAKLDYLQSTLPRMIGERLSSAGFSVIDAKTTLELLKSGNVKMLDLAKAKELATRGKAQFALYGSLNAIGEGMSIDARLVSASGAQDTKAIYVTGKGKSNIVPAVDELAKKVRNQVFQTAIVADIDVKGLKTLDKDVVLMRMKTKKGDPYDPLTLNDEIKRLFDLGYFDDVRISVEDLPEGKKVVVELVEKPRIKTIDVVGGGGIDKDDVLAVMSTKVGAVLNPKILSEDLAKIRELYRKDGYYLAKINYELEGVETGQARLNIVVEQAKKLYIEEIVLEGNTAFSDSDLEGEMALKERSIISWLTGTGVLQEELLDRDAAALEEFYANHGYVDVKVGQPKVEYLEEGIKITFTIVEGERYKAGTVNFAGDLLVPTDELLKVSKADEMPEKDDGWFNRSILRDDSNNLANFYKDFGYAYATTDVGLQRDEQAKVINVTYKMKKGQKVYIRRVLIEGNDKTRDNVIRRDVAVSDGDLFSGSALEVSSNKLKRLDIFESADIETVPTDDPALVDLKVKVKEKSTGQLSGGVGYSSYAGAYIAVKLEEKNLFGKGYNAKLTGSFSGIDTNYVASFTDPRFMDSQMGLGADLYYTYYSYNDFDKDTIGGILRMSYPIGYFTRLYWAYRLDWYDITDVDEDAADSIEDAKGEAWASVFSVSALRDTTNRNINPSDGSKNSLSLEYGGGPLQGDDDYFKVIADTSWYFLLPWFTENIFHTHGQVGGVFDNGTNNEVPVFEKFYLGGMQSVRGYDTRTISPRDSRTHELIGGDYEAFINLEYIFPLDSDIGLVGLFFFDAGDAWDDSHDFDLKKSVGVGVRWFSPMGPLRLEYGYGMDETYDQDSQSKIEFSIGQFF